MIKDNSQTQCEIYERGICAFSFRELLEIYFRCPRPLLLAFISRTQPMIRKTDTFQARHVQDYQEKRPNVPSVTNHRQAG